MAGGPITVEELQILITAEYGDVIRGMLKMVDQVKQIAETKIAPIKKTLQQATSLTGDTSQQAVKATETAAVKTVQAVQKAATAARKSIDEMITDHDYLNEKIRLSQQQYDLMREKLAKIQDGGDTMTSVKLSKQILEADRKIESMIRESDKMAESIRQIESAVSRTNIELHTAENTIKHADKQMRKFGETAKKATKSGSAGLRGFIKILERTIKYMVVFQLIGKVVDAVTDGITNMAEQSESANKTLSAYLSSFTYLQNSLASVVMPILEMLEPLVTTVVDLLADGLNYLGMFIAALTGQTTYKKAIKTQENFAESIDETAKAAEKAKYALAGFDEVNILDFGDSAEALEEVATAFEEVEIPQTLQNIAKFLGISKNDNNTSGGNFDPSKVTAYADAVENATENVKEFSVALDGLELPVWTKEKIPAPEFEPVTAPAINLQAAFYPSREKYGLRVPAPVLEPATAPAVNTNDYETAKSGYLTPVPAPAFLPVVAPSIDITKLAESLLTMRETISESLETAKITVMEWGLNVKSNIKTSLEYAVETVQVSFNSMVWNSAKALTLMASYVKAWGENVMENFHATLEYIPVVVDAGVRAAATAMVSFVKTSSQNVAAWGTNLVTNIGTTMKNWYEMFKSTLKSAWESFKSFAEATGEKVAGWWNENKETVGQVATGVALAGVTALAIYSGAPAIIAGGKALASFAATAATAGGTALAAGAFANGGVITSPTIGLMGEYSGARANPEIVTPQNIMYDTVVEANAPLVSAMYDMIREVIAAINNKDTTLELDGDAIGSYVVNYITKKQRITGKSPV